MESPGHFHQICNRVGLHLLHHLASVCLHCDFADAKLATDLFIQQPGDDQRHDLPLLTAQLDHASRVHLVAQVKKVLEEYKVSLIHKKVLELQEAVTECFQTLCRKKDSLGRIIVDPNDFSVTLQDKHNRPLPKAQLSVVYGFSGPPEK